MTNKITTVAPQAKRQPRQPPGRSPQQSRWHCCIRRSQIPETDLVTARRAISVFAGFRLCVPKTSFMSCDQVIFVDHATEASLASDVVIVEMDWFGQRFQWRGVAQGAVWPVLIVVGLVLMQDLRQVGLVSDEGAGQEFAAASSDPAFAKDTSTLMSESPDSPVQPTRGPGRSDAWGG
jgi:hypothetical protein